VVDVSKRLVLVVDDDVELCNLVRATLELEGIDVLDAGHAIEAERMIDERVPDAIVLDIGLPGIDGLFYCERLRENPRTRSVPIVVISGSGQAGERAEVAGATAYLRKPFDPLDLLTLLERSMGVTPLAHVGTEPAELRSLVEIGRRRHEQTDAAHRQTLLALVAALDSRDFGSSDHSQRATAYGVRLALEVAPSLTDDPSLEWGFLLHDVGKIGISDQILRKPGALDAAERQEMEKHTVIGEHLLTALPLLEGEGLRVVRSHHERWDGTGYPDGLAGRAIPMGARIFAVADALDAMTDHRPYRAAVTWDEAMAEIRRQSGTQFDPDVVDGLEACEPDLAAIRDPQAKTLTASGGSGAP
jgi:response regulator RpfG family c-di-GMP phosphodiesterase